MFKVWNNNAFDFSAGQGALEPLQLGVRSLIERATVEMVANIYGAPGPQVCMQSDPLGTGVTTGALLRGVRYVRDGAITDSIVMRSRSGTVRRIEARHNLGKLTQFTGREFR